MKPKSFLPRDKPKSWVAMLIAILIALLIASPLMILGSVLQWPLLYTLAWSLFLALWALAALCGAVFLARLLGGKYKALQARAWREQIW